jgi:trehalose 6-phosphate phosphatase
MINDTLRTRIQRAEHIWLFLDYDGTLADFADTPDQIIPDPELNDLLRKLLGNSRIRIAIISGRRLSHIEKLVDISGIWLAGSYGVEMRLPDGQYIERVAYDKIRPPLEKLKPHWAELLNNQDGFYLEDKGWSLAVHARFAEDKLANQIIRQASAIAKQQLSLDTFTILDGHKFLEAAPRNANKANTARYLLDQAVEARDLVIYLGDDDKDEKAFPVVQAWGGLAGQVSGPRRKSSADFRLESPNHTRQWLFNLYNQIQE